MKLVVLGCWAPYPAPNQACSGYLLEIAGRRILVDLGHGAFGKLQHILDFSSWMPCLFPTCILTIVPI